MQHAFPPSLHPGDRIGIVSTARKISPQELQPALAILEGWGLQPVLGQTIGAASHQFAGDDSLRLSDFQNMLDDAAIKAILCARGGYGTVRIIDRLDFSPLQRHPKWIIGYSDITVLHAHLQRHLGIPTLHASMPVNFATNTPDALESLRRALFGEKLHYTINPSHFNRPGRATGRLTGGNLSMLYSFTGSPSAVDTTGAILFMEDLDEYLYHIDRMMMNLKRCGMLAAVNGIIIGGMTDMTDNEIPFGKTAEEIISEHLAGLEGPICFEFPAGHLEDNRALILGAEVTLKVGEKAVELEFPAP